MTQRQKQSFMAGALTSSVGIFISKAIGLFYIVPFSAMATSSNMVFYSQAYTYYELLLNICTAGFPFAIAALVARYANKNDFKTVMLVRKLSMSLMLASGFTVAIVFGLLSSPLAKASLGPQAPIEDIKILQTCFIILTVAIVLVPFLSVFRGFYQGLKELKVYAVSQVIEQVTRVGTLLGLGAFCVYVLKLDSIYSIYMAVLATSLAAIIAILYYYKFDRKNIGDLNRAARYQKEPSVPAKELFKELLLFGLPYLLASVLGNSMSIVNNMFFMSAVKATPQTYNYFTDVLGIMQTNCNKLTSIPQVLAIGFGAGIVPYLTISLENKNWRELQKNVLDCLDTVLYIGMPLFICLLVLAGPIYYVMYGTDNLAIGTEVLRWSSAISITGTLSPICSSMMMTLRLRRQSIFYLFIGFIVKLVSFFVLINMFGYSGALTSSILTSVVVIFLNLQLIQNKYHVHYGRTFKRFFRICLGLLAMNGSFVILQWLGLDVESQGRLLATVYLGIYGIVGLGTYYFATSCLGLPKAILGITLTGVIKKVVRRGKAS
ncbi:MAG: oligosaccharide flippase family protein [Anaerorhabdus sp.]|uniref:oligosaccharide flippase family protein n=1 Tax=Anaerorhabdus sp. TaxID=1872524 RepID=UPI002FCB79D4